MLGSVYLTARLLYGWLHVRRLWRRLRPLDAKRWAAELAQVTRMLCVERLPVICISPDVRSPLAAGLFFPRVILPESLPERSSSHQLRDILLHECAHVLRRDSWVRLLQRLAGVLFWVHPLVHLLNRRLDHAREEVCDNHVLAHTNAAEYAETLLRVSKICYPTPRLEGYLTMIPYRHNLERRVAGLLETRRDTATRLPILQRTAVLTAFILLLGATASVRVAQPPPLRMSRERPHPPHRRPRRNQSRLPWTSRVSRSFHCAARSSPRTALQRPARNGLGGENHYRSAGAARDKRRRKGPLHSRP